MLGLKFWERAEQQEPVKHPLKEWFFQSLFKWSEDPFEIDNLSLLELNDCIGEA